MRNDPQMTVEPRKRRRPITLIFPDGSVRWECADEKRPIGDDR
jgi:hypothetical protein